MFTSRRGSDWPVAIVMIDEYPGQGWSAIDLGSTQRSVGQRIAASLSGRRKSLIGFVRNQISGSEGRFG